MTDNTTELNMDAKVTVINLAPWPVGFPNHISRGDTCVAASGRTRVKREELVDQVSAGNKLLVGFDSYGSHATLYIDDEATRKYLEFDSEDGKRKQQVISDDKVKQWFELKTQSAFERNIKENVKTRAEKSFLLNAINRLKLDSYEKIHFCEDYCRFRLI